ncbi:MAG: single-strand DNA-binding protein [Parcubacteria group bacterium Athens1014_10]|nr:MAG: single-strand DNA-binding protein [Parcubacteria group bacterium Athens1014_10]TSD05872.1 MAG: single-strand DNA-binding protein [Parcubacteria group bacterium Athens0714_12]
MDLNKVMIIGRLTRDPESRNTPQGANVTSFGIATNFVWTNAGGERQEKVEYHNIIAWRKLGEICAQYLQKGRRVYIEGRLQTQKFTDKDGNQRSKTEIVADNMIMLDSKSTSPSESAPKRETSAETPAMEELKEEINIEEVPF